MTAEEAGRKSYDHSVASIMRKDRLRKLLEAIEHVEGDESVSIGGTTTTSASTTSLATLLAHAGIESGGMTENFPMSPPLHTATTYTRPPDGIYKEGDSIYARMDNPTRLLLEKTVFELECSRLIESNAQTSPNPTSLAFSSGMQAVTSILLAHSTRGKEGKTTVLIPTDVYHGVRSLLSDVFSRHGVDAREMSMVVGDADDKSTGAPAIVQTISDIASAFSKREERPGKHDEITNDRSSVIVWMETPSNPKCEVVDIESICKAIRKEEDSWKEILDVTTVVDGTMASPILTRPLELGSDISFHSGTKYMGGHSDALIGTVTVSPVTSRGKELFPLLKSVQIAGGGVASPWDSWLTLRGMRTLHLRVERQCITALLLAEYLREKMLGYEENEGEVEVLEVHYPGLSSHPQHDLAKRQMVLATSTGNKEQPANGYGGVLSFELADEVEATAFAAALRIAQRATSLGGTETLVEHRASIEPPESVVSPQGLLRVSVGLEDPNDLIRDFEEAFAIAAEVLMEA